MNDDLKFAFAQRATWVWLLLVVATCFSWAMGTGVSQGTGANAGALSSLLILIALAKVRLVIRYFMEVQDSALVLRVLMDAWCVLVGATLLALYWGLFGTTA